MTIDEVIAEEKKNIAVNKDKYEFECRYYGKDTVERGPKLDCVKEYEYHMQIVELLDELNKRRNADEGYLADIYQDIGYNKAIDDFVKYIDECTGWTPNCIEHDISLTVYTLHQIAEQLKAGGENE